jgi:O-acetylserine/cysteine efflux transporter
MSRSPILALSAAGVLWGLTVPLSKVALVWLDPAWLAAARFALAAPLLAWAGQRGLRRALSARVALAGAFGYGLVIVLENAGIERTSAVHASLVIGAVPLIAALFARLRGERLLRSSALAGQLLSLGGIALVAGSGGGDASSHGDLLVLGSAVLSAALIAAQPELLAGRDPAAVTAIQFAAGAVLAAAVGVLAACLPPVARVTGGPSGLMHALAHPAAIASFAALVVLGTVLPFWLFALGQASVSAQTAGAFLNLEPLVGALFGWLALGEPASLRQVTGAVAVLAGIFAASAVGGWPPALEARRALEARGPHPRPDRGARRRLSRWPPANSATSCRLRSVSTRTIAEKKRYSEC